MGDQEILLKTNVKLVGVENKEFETISRKSRSQSQTATFPVFMYNIGMRKLVIHNTLTNGKQYVYELGSHESFVSFVEFNKFEDIGFYPDNLRIEMCSHFCFLTRDKKTNTNLINFLLIDPYYEHTQIALFKSHMRFPIHNSKKFEDVVIKNIVYCTKKNKNDTDFEIKCLTQYPTFFNIDALDDADEEDSYYEQTGSEDSDYYSEDEEGGGN